MGSDQVSTHRSCRLVPALQECHTHHCHSMPERLYSTQPVLTGLCFAQILLRKGPAEQVQGTEARRRLGLAFRFGLADMLWRAPLARS